MTLLDKLEKRFSRYAIRNITTYIIGIQVFTFLALMVTSTSSPSQNPLEAIQLVPDKVMAGEVWRLLTFAAAPPGASLWAFFAFWVFWIGGNAIEQSWGAFRYNLFLLVGYVSTVSAAMLLPLAFPEAGGVPAANSFIMMSVFLAFAHLYPNFEFLMFFILPVKVKWLAWFTWIMLGVAFLGGSPVTQVTIFASVANWNLFFMPGIVRGLRNQERHRRRVSVAKEEAEAPFHTCTTCGRTDKSDPDLEFRYVETNAGVKCFCGDHLPDAAEASSPTRSPDAPGPPDRPADSIGSSDAGAEKRFGE